MKDRALVKTRFAPSPTGFLHLGHAYAALFAARLAEKSSGQFLLRFEDIDHTRTRPKYYQAIEDDLTWLGLTWPRPALRQTDRQPAYQAALDQFRSADLLYPCFCTRKEIQTELAQLTSAPHGPADTPPCPRGCRTLPAEKIASLSKNRDPVWRFHTTEASRRLPPLFFHEKNEPVPVETSRLGDPILARRDIGTSYHLSVVLDDAFQEITHVTRGLDLLPATHLHRLLQESLGLPEPAYHHHALIHSPEGTRLAKRDSPPSLRDLRHDGLTLQNLLSQLPSF